MSSGEPRVPVAFGRRTRDLELEGPPAAPAPIQLPPLQLLVEPEVDRDALDAVCVVVRDSFYAAAREGLADAVRDFAAEQQAATAAEQAVSPPV